MAASDAAVGRLKAELKRALRKHISEAVNDFCDSFVDELRPVGPKPTPHVGAQGNEVNYECCRGLVEYMERNMETSPGFVQQMDCVILAYQSNASMDILNAVVTQNLWARRKGARDDSLEKETMDLRLGSGDDVDTQFTAKAAVSGGSSKGGKVTSKVNGGIAANAAGVRAEKSTSGSETAKQMDLEDAGDAVPVKNVDTEMKTVVHQGAAVRIEKLPHNSSKQDQTERRRVNGSHMNVFQVADVCAQANAVFASSGTAAIVSSASPAVPAKSSKTRSLLVQKRTEVSRKSSTEKDILDSSSAQISATESTGSRPREWGKRKRLVTRKRREAAAAPAKRARKMPPQPIQLSDHSSTETDNSDDEKTAVDDKANELPTKKKNLGAAAAVETKSAVVEQRHTSISKEAPSKRNEPEHTKRLVTPHAQVVGVGLQADKVTHEKGSVPAIVKAASGTMMSTAADHVRALNPKSGKGNGLMEQAATCNGAAKLTKAAAVDTALTQKKGAKTGKAKEKKRKENENAAEQAGSSAPGALVARRTTESMLESDLRQVERDLAAGEMVSGLEVAKTMFQEMLDGLARSKSREKSCTVLAKAKSDKDPIGVLCDPARRSTDQTAVFKTRLRNTIAIVDATLCNPPLDHFCSRDCNSIRAQMCNEVTPCINPTCRAWHDAEAHLERCTNDQCEFSTRIELRETMHLIEHKQQQIANACNALLDANATLLSPTRSNNKERASVGNAEAFKLIETLEQDLEALKREQADLIDIKLRHWAALNSIGINSSSDKTDGFPVFASHYSTRSHQRKADGK